MGRINISITKKDTNEWIINRKFCRSSALEFLCENSDDEKLKDFDYKIIMGVELDGNNVHSFIDRIQYVIDYLLAIPQKYREQNFSKGDTLVYTQFIDDLKNSRDYLKLFISKNNIDEYLIEILQ